MPYKLLSSVSGPVTNLTTTSVYPYWPINVTWSPPTVTNSPIIQFRIAITLINKNCQVYSVIDLSNGINVFIMRISTLYCQDITGNASISQNIISLSIIFTPIMTNAPYTITVYPINRFGSGVLSDIRGITSQYDDLQRTTNTTTTTTTTTTTPTTTPTTTTTTTTTTTPLTATTPTTMKTPTTETTTTTTTTPTTTTKPMTTTQSTTVAVRGLFLIPITSTNPKAACAQDSGSSAGNAIDQTDTANTSCTATTPATNSITPALTITFAAPMTLATVYIITTLAGAGAGEGATSDASTYSVYWGNTMATAANSGSAVTCSNTPATLFSATNIISAFTCGTNTSGTVLTISQSTAKKQVIVCGILFYSND